jgi:hypothetical protein
MRRTGFARVLIPVVDGWGLAQEKQRLIARWADLLPDLSHALHVLHHHEESNLEVIETLEQLAAKRWSSNRLQWLATASRAAAAPAATSGAVPLRLRRQGVRPDAVVDDSEDDDEGAASGWEEDDDEEDDKLSTVQPPRKRRMYHSEIGDGAFDDSDDLVSSVEGGAAGGGSAAAAPMPPSWFWS